VDMHVWHQWMGGEKVVGWSAGRKPLLGKVVERACKNERVKARAVRYSWRRRGAD